MDWGKRSWPSKAALAAEASPIAKEASSNKNDVSGNAPDAKGRGPAGRQLSKRLAGLRRYIRKRRRAKKQQIPRRPESSLCRDDNVEAKSAGQRAGG